MSKSKKQGASKVLEEFRRDPLKRVTLEFYRKLFEGKFAEADRILNRISKKFGGEKPGYVHALVGFYNAYISNDEETMLFRLWKDKNVREIKDEIVKDMDRMSKRIMAGESSSYYEAWRDFLKIVDSLPTPHKFKEGK